MFMLNPPALLLGSIVAAGVLTAMLLFSGRETVAELRQLFDVQMLYRAAKRARRFTLRQLLVGTALCSLGCAVVVYVTREHGLNALVLLGVALGYLAVVVVPLLVIFFSDAFGPGPRERWQRYLDREERPELNLRNEEHEVTGSKKQ